MASLFSRPQYFEVMTTDTDRLFPAPPEVTEPLAASNPSKDVRDFLSKRRSASKRGLRAPGPEGTALDELLYVASRVPDHRKLGPWRYIVFEGDARAAFGETILKVFQSKNPDATDKQIDEERGRFLRAPTVVVVVSSPVEDGRTPIWEQELSSGAVCYNLLLAANASGWAGVWLSEWIAFDKDIAKAMGLEDHERISGVMYLGTTDLSQPERPRPNVTERISRWKV